MLLIGSFDNNVITFVVSKETNKSSFQDLRNHFQTIFNISFYELNKINGLFWCDFNIYCDIAVGDIFHCGTRKLYLLKQESLKCCPFYYR